MLEIFAFRLSSAFNHSAEWQKLVQVCQRWRQIIYGSPRYLDLHHDCSNERPFKNLSRWPEFPLALHYTISYENKEVDDLVAALKQPSLVRRVDLMVPHLDARVDDVLKKMKVPFPALTDLNIMGPDRDASYFNIEEHDGVSLPRNFLGKSAPCLQRIYFEAVNATSFRNFPKLLSSARGLVTLRIEDIPPNCWYEGHKYILPMVEALAGLTKLKTLCINFRFPRKPHESNEGFDHGMHPERRTRAVFPALTRLIFSGESEYLEDIVARIDMPRLEDIEIEYFPLTVEVHELSQFLCRTTNLDLAQFRRAQIDFDVDTAYSQIKLYPAKRECRQVRFELGVSMAFEDSDRELDDLVTCMTRVLGQLTGLLSNVGHLYFKELQAWSKDRNRLDSAKLLPLLHLFPAVKKLHASGVLAGHVATVLENIDEERATEVMPALRSLQLGSGSGKEPVGSTERFLSLRRRSGRPVAVVNSTQDKA